MASELIAIGITGQVLVAMILLTLSTIHHKHVSIEGASVIARRGTMSNMEGDDHGHGGSIPGLARHAHQTLSCDATRVHVDVMGKGLEGKLGITLGGMLASLRLPVCGGIGAAVPSALVFPMYGLQTLLGAIGAGEEDGYVEVSCATSPLACHANVGAGERYMFLRSMSALYKGASLCDHPNDTKVGSVAYIQRLRDAGTSLRDAWAITAMGGRNRWQAATAQERHQVLVQLQVHASQYGAVARNINPNLA